MPLEKVAPLIDVDVPNASVVRVWNLGTVQSLRLTFPDDVHVLAFPRETPTAQRCGAGGVAALCGSPTLRERAAHRRVGPPVPTPVRHGLCPACLLAPVTPVEGRPFFVYDIRMPEDEVSEEQIQQWADEAEAGYDVAALKRRGRGRPGRGAEPMQVVAVRLNAEEIAALDTLAEREHLTRSEAIRRALANFAA